MFLRHIRLWLRDSAVVGLFGRSPVLVGQPFGMRPLVRPRCGLLLALCRKARPQPAKIPATHHRPKNCASFG